jgi:hypothetical protein
MSYPGFQGYSGNYGPTNNQSTAYDARRSSAAAAPPSTSTAYPVSSSQQQYGSAAYAWPDRSQSTYGDMNGNTQHYGSMSWKDGQSQQPMYDYQRPQTNYAASSSSTNTHGWYGAHTQPQAQPSTQALSNLAYASGLDAQEQHPQGDRRAAHGHSGSQNLNSAQRDVSAQERVQSPSYDRRYRASNTRTSQTSRSKQSPTSAHQDLAVSAAAALAGAVNHRYNSSPRQPTVSTQQDYQPSAPLVANEAEQNSDNAVVNQHHQWLTSHHDPNARSQLQRESQLPSSAPVPARQTLSRYETTETHRYAHSTNSNVALPLPSTTVALQPRSSHGFTERTDHNNAGAGYSPEKADTSNQGPSASNSIEASNGVSRKQQPEPATSMPTFIDPSQVFNPYHKEHERQKREEAERAKRASTDVSEQNLGSRANDASTNPPVKAADTTVASGSKQPARVSGSTDTGVRPPSRSSSMTAESKEPADVDMANEMKAMMHRLREWKSKDPSLFQKLWGDMKKGGGSTQATKVPTPAQSPQLAQVAPQYPGQSQSSQSEQLQQSEQLEQPEQLQPPPAPQMLSQKETSSSHTASKTSSKSTRHRDLTIDNNEERLPDLGRFPAERRQRRMKQITEAKARREEAKQPKEKPSTIPALRAQPKPSTVPGPSAAQVQATIPPARATPAAEATSAKQDEKLTWPTQSTSQPTTATDAVSTATSTQTLPPMNTKGNTIWPEAKRKALAEAAQKALMGLAANKGKSITAGEIHALLEQNPSYIELCANLEARGFVFHRGQFARFLLSSVPDLPSPSQTQAKPSEQLAHSISSPVQPPQHVVPSEPAAPLNTANGSSIQLKYQPAHQLTYMNHRPTTAPPKKAAPNGVAKPRLGVPSPTIPTPVPGSKEANARKRDFSELVDLTQLSDDEDYVMPRKQARHEASPETEVYQVQSDILQPNGAKRTFNMPSHSYGPSHENPYGRLGAGMPSQSFDQQGSTFVSQLQSHAPAQPSQPMPMPQRSRHLLAKRLNKAEALRKSYYDPKTVARDILIAAGRHPLEHPLNAHLAGILGKHIDIDSDLSTFDWESVDPGGPPMPIVEVVEIPAGPPRWKVGERPDFRGPAMGTFASASKVRRVETARPLEQKATVSDASPIRHVSKEPCPENADKSHTVVVPSLARLTSQTRSLLEASFKGQSKPGQQPTRLRQSQNVDEDSPPHARLQSRKEIAPHRPQSLTSTTPINSTSVSPQVSHKRGRGRPRKLSIVQPLSSIMDGPPAQPAKRRGRPPVHKSKHPSAYMLKKAVKSSGLQVSVPVRRRSTSPPQYNIYACQWRDCDAKLHNLPTLRKHITKVHKAADDEPRSEGLPCWWKNCRTLEHRGEESIPKVTFNSTADWLHHIESDHLHPIGMKLGDGPSSAQTGKPQPFEVSKYFYHHPPPRSRSAMPPRPSKPARTCSHTDPQTLERDRQSYLCDDQGRVVTAPSTKSTIRHYPADTLILSSVTMNPESNIPTRAFSKAHDNEKMDIRQSAVETLVALQKHKEMVGPGLDRGGCTLVNKERSATLLDGEGLMRVVDASY